MSGSFEAAFAAKAKAVQPGRRRRGGKSRRRRRRRRKRGGRRLLEQKKKKKKPPGMKAFETIAPHMLNVETMQYDDPALNLKLAEKMCLTGCYKGVPSKCFLGLKGKDWGCKGSQCTPKHFADQYLAAETKKSDCEAAKSLKGDAEAFKRAALKHFSQIPLKMTTCKTLFHDKQFDEWLAMNTWKEMEALRCEYKFADARAKLTNQEMNSRAGETNLWSHVHRLFYRAPKADKRDQHFDNRMGAFRRLENAVKKSAGGQNPHFASKHPLSVTPC